MGLVELGEALRARVRSLQGRAPTSAVRPGELSPRYLATEEKVARRPDNIHDKYDSVDGGATGKYLQLHRLRRSDFPESALQGIVSKYGKGILQFRAGESPAVEAYPVMARHTDGSLRQAIFALPRPGYPGPEMLKGADGFVVDGAGKPLLNAKIESLDWKMERSENGGLLNAEKLPQFQVPTPGGNLTVRGVSEHELPEGFLSQLTSRSPQATGELWINRVKFLSGNVGYHVRFPDEVEGIFEADGRSAREAAATFQGTWKMAPVPSLVGPTANKAIHDLATPDALSKLEQGGLVMARRRDGGWEWERDWKTWTLGGPEDSRSKLAVFIHPQGRIALGRVDTSGGAYSSAPSRDYEVVNPALKSNILGYMRSQGAELPKNAYSKS